MHETVLTYLWDILWGRFQNIGKIHTNFHLANSWNRSQGFHVSYFRFSAIKSENRFSKYFRPFLFKMCVFFVVVVFQVCFLCNGKYLNRNVCFWTAAIVIVWLIAVKYRVVFWLVFSIIFIQDVSINGARILAKPMYICFLEFLLFKAIKAVVTFGPCVSITS